MQRTREEGAHVSDPQEGSINIRPSELLNAGKKSTSTVYLQGASVTQTPPEHMPPCVHTEQGSLLENRLYVGRDDKSPFWSKIVRIGGQGSHQKSDTCPQREKLELRRKF